MQKYKIPEQGAMVSVQVTWVMLVLDGASGITPTCYGPMEERHLTLARGRGRGSLHLHAGLLYSYNLCMVCKLNTERESQSNATLRITKFCSACLCENKSESWAKCLPSQKLIELRIEFPYNYNRHV